MWKWIIYYSIAVLLGGVFAIFDMPFWMAMVFLLLLSLVFLGQSLFTIYASTNTRKIEKFITSKKKEPIYRFIHAQGFCTKEEQLAAIDAILHEYKQPHIQHYYRYLRYFLQEEFELALEEAANIDKEDLRHYSKALVYAQIGNETKALSYALSKPWMQEAILAYIAKSKEDYQSFEKHAQLSIAGARGIQRLSLVYAFKSMQPPKEPSSS